MTTLCLKSCQQAALDALAAHAVATLAREWQATDAPVALWLVPSDTTRSQTLKALQTAGHPYRDALQAQYGAGVRVCVLDDLDAVPPETLRRHLEDELQIPAEQIKVATGDTRELEGLDQASRSCPVRFVITVQALREGWDCPFAYVLCSLQKLSSATAVEQLLGRVLRMPYARPSGRDALNRAYAHVCEAKFSSAASELADRLIHNMGFEALDVASMVAQQSLLPISPLFESNQPLAQSEPALVATTFIVTTASVALMAAAGVDVTQMGGEDKLVVTGHISTDVEALLALQVRGAKKQDAVRDKVAQHNALVAAQSAPASRGARFAPIPTLAYRSTPQGQLFPLEREAVLEAVELDLLTPEAVQLPGFQIVEQSNGFEIYLKDAHIKLAQDIEARLGDLKDKAARASFRQLVLKEAWTIEPDWTRPLVFEASRYPVPAGSRYGGRYEFRKHFYPVLADLKDGGEEFSCAQLLDRHANVKHWVRNLVTAPCGFSLTTSRGRFFPDFVAELLDGRVAVAEYKGAHLLNEPYEIEKRQVGTLWARKSQSRCLFGQIALQRDGLSRAGQLDALLN